jgi:hypothetical protein
MEFSAVTIADLIAQGKLLEVACQRCSRHQYIDARSLPVEPTQPVPTLARRLRCIRCNARNGNTAAEFWIWARPDARPPKMGAQRYD